MKKVMAVATVGFNTASGKYYCNYIKHNESVHLSWGFNTASGKYYCNVVVASFNEGDYFDVSIPQAVSTIAMKRNDGIHALYGRGFNTASGKYYCNINPQKPWLCIYEFQYRKR